MDSHVSLALALDSLPGRFAALIGAGVSVAAGLPSAWDVQQDLIRRVATAQGEPVLDDPDAWWRNRHPTGFGYDDLLAALADTQSNRAALLRPYFEPDDDDRESALKRPSGVHRSIARLVRDGRIPIVLTLNFDTLIETALRDEGIEPVVIARPAALDGIEPLPHQKALVVHLHGDYLSPDTLNTPDELGAYDPRLNEFLDEVFDRYGLVIAGWSAKWDVALRARLEGARSPRYGTWWVDVRPLGLHASQLATARRATVAIEDAGEFLGRAADATDALADRRQPDPISSPAAVGYAKRALAGRTVAIPLHDALHREMERVADLEPVRTRSFDSQQLHAEVGRRAQQVLTGTGALLALVATTAYWGDERTDAWWLPDITRLAPSFNASGLTDLIDLTRAPAALVTQTAGIAAVAAGRTHIAVALLRDIELGWPGQDPLPIGVALDPGLLWPTPADPDLGLREHLRPILADELALGRAAFGQAWEDWHLLRYLAADFLAERGRRSYIRWSPLLLAEGYSHHYVAIASRRLRHVLDNDLPAALALAAITDDDPALFGEVLERFDTRYGEWAHEAAWKVAGTSGGISWPGSPHYPARPGLHTS